MLRNGPQTAESDYYEYDPLARQPASQPIDPFPATAGATIGDRSVDSLKNNVVGAENKKKNFDTHTHTHAGAAVDGHA